MRVGSGQWTVDGVIQTISSFKAQKITPISFFYEFGFTPLCVHVCACMHACESVRALCENMEIMELKTPLRSETLGFSLTVSDMQSALGTMCLGQHLSKGS